MAISGPPAYAWDWLARQRLLWREARARLASDPSPTAARYRAIETRSDVVAALRADYPREETVRHVVDDVVAELAFLGLTDRGFATLAISNPPRGMRWWWTALTGEDLDPPTGAANRTPVTAAPDVQLTLDTVLEGYGD